MKNRAHIWLLITFTTIFLVACFFFTSEYYKLKHARHDVEALSNRIQAFETIIHSENWREEFLDIIAEGSDVKRRLIESHSYTPRIPDNFLSERFLRNWYYNLKQQQVKLPETDFTYEAILPKRALADDWKGELTEISFLTETFTPEEIRAINFREEFISDVWLRYCTLKLRVNYVALLGYLQKSQLFVWEYHFDQGEDDLYELEIIYCVRLQEVMR